MRKIDKNQTIRAIERSNPWWQGEGVGVFRDLPHRVHFDRLLALVKQTNPRRALILMGPRRIGKTVLIYQIIDRLNEERKDPKKIVYLSLDNPLFRLSDLEELLTWSLEWAGTSADGTTVFFDEIQYLDTWEQQLKVLVDAYPNTKFVATGSAAAALHKKSTESGAGRFTDYLLPPLSFYEFILIKGALEKTPRDSIDLPKLNDLYLEYLNYGGFPESLTSESVRNQPEQYIGQDILDKVLGRDLPSIFGLTNPNELNRLFTALAYNTSNEVSPESISKEAGIPKNDINRYIEFLEAAFLIQVIDKTDNEAKTFQRRRNFKVILTNPSLRSAIFGKVSLEDPELEALAETAVYSQLALHRPGPSTYKYAKWNRGGVRGEVDLVNVNNSGAIQAALEVKWSDRFALNEEKPKSLIYFCREHQIRQCYMTSKSIFAKSQYQEIEVIHFPTAFLCYVLGFIGGFTDRMIDLALAMYESGQSNASKEAFTQFTEAMFYLKKTLMAEHFGPCSKAVFQIYQSGTKKA